MTTLPLHRVMELIPMGTGTSRELGSWKWLRGREISLASMRWRWSPCICRGSSQKMYARGL
jgi:hypothetical protein